MYEARNEPLEKLLRKLAEIARRGPIPSASLGDTGVGVTLLDALGLSKTSTNKASIDGIVITAHRHAKIGKGNRVNLFAQVPNWKLSECKSSREIAERYGYDIDNGNARRLYCTVSARRANSQGLQLEVNTSNGVLEEVATSKGRRDLVAVWLLNQLEDRLRASHPTTIWVRAVTCNNNGQECFHYRECVYTGAARTEELTALLATGTITMDHLIDIKSGRACEKGPLFKMNPENFDLLFPPPRSLDLLSSRWI